jgi:hypothetical protein
MFKSESIKELAAALAKAQAEMTPASKDAKNPHFKSSYATLASAIEATRGPLAKHGLSVVQTFKSEGEGLHLLTTLMHSSGEYISSDMRLLIGRNDMQALGSASSYARRYSLMAITGIGQDDDDGEGAVKREEKTRTFQESVNENAKKANEWAEPVHKNKPSIMDLAKFTITFGPNRGKQLQDIDPESLQHSIDKAKIWIQNNPKHPDLMSVVDFTDTAVRYLNYSATSKSADFNDPKKPLANHAPGSST